jgi:hypothetical protein
MVGFSIIGTTLSVCSPNQSVNMIVRVLGGTTSLVLKSGVLFSCVIII